jgi:hypothetical protein
LRNLGCLQQQRALSAFVLQAESNASNGPMHASGPLTVKTFYTELFVWSQHNNNNNGIPDVGGGPPLLVPRCSAARAGSAIHSCARRRPRPPAISEEKVVVFYQKVKLPQI